MKSTTWFRQTLAVTAALCTVGIFSHSSALADIVNVDPQGGFVGTVNDDTTLGSSTGYQTLPNTTYLVGDTSAAGDNEARMWVRYQLPGPSPGNNSIASARLIVGPFDFSQSVNGSPGLQAAIASDAVNGGGVGDGDSWNSGNITNILKNVDGARLKNMFNLDATPGGMVDIDVTNWFDLATGEGLGKLLTVRLMGSVASGYVPFTGDSATSGLWTLGSGANGTAPNGTTPLIRLELTLVPEPSSAVLAGFAVAGVAVMRRRRSA